MPKTVKRDDIDVAVRATLLSFTEPQNIGFLKSYIENYLASDDADNFLIETYSQSGVLAGGKALFSLVTPERIKRINANIQVKIGFQKI